jgi:ketosteroid isomerase-like protein
MSQENVELARQAYAAYNAGLNAPNPRGAIRAWLERFGDPEIVWEIEPTAPGARTIYQGVDGVMKFFDLIHESFEPVRQVPERFIDCGDRVLVFLRSEARARTTGLELNEEWAHLLTARDGKAVRVQQFRNRDEALEAAGPSEKGRTA